MITFDNKRQVPTEWTTANCQELFEHARELGQNGNPAGFSLTVDLFPFVGDTKGEERYLKPSSQWDYDNIRSWIADHLDQVEQVWKLTVSQLD